MSFFFFLIVIFYLLVARLKIIISEKTDQQNTGNVLHLNFDYIMVLLSLFMTC
jgi:hypothetical protein